jgi:hypothetical protein
MRRALPPSSALSLGRRAFAAAAAAPGFPAPLFVTEAATGRVLSPWHDVPLRPRGQPPAVLNFLCEIPRGAQPPKLELDPAAPHNAIVQDKNKDGSPRRYRLDTCVAARARRVRRGARFARRMQAHAAFARSRACDRGAANACARVHVRTRRRRARACARAHFAAPSPPLADPHPFSRSLLAATALARACARAG